MTIIFMILHCVIPNYFGTKLRQSQTHLNCTVVTLRSWIVAIDIYSSDRYMRMRADRHNRVHPASSACEIVKWRLLRTLGISRYWAWLRIFVHRVRRISNCAFSACKRFLTSSHRRASRHAPIFSLATFCLHTRKTLIWRDHIWNKRSVASYVAIDLAFLYSCPCLKYTWFFLYYPRSNCIVFSI